MSLLLLVKAVLKDILEKIIIKNNIKGLLDNLIKESNRNQYKDQII